MIEMIASEIKPPGICVYYTVKTNVLPQHIIEVQYNGLKIGLFLCAVIAHFFVL